MSRGGAIHAIVLAGGAGTRFWPLSREARPKPLLAVGGGHTLLEQTLARARRVATAARTWLVCGRAHAAAMSGACGLPADRVLVEPAMRNTAMAIGYAALVVAQRDPEAVLAVMPADASIPDARAFAAAMRVAARAARRERVLVTIGVTPTRPETGFGYIRLGEAVGAPHPGLHRVQRFVEKPPLRRARSFLRRGGYLWNAGIFVWRAATLLEELEACAPDVHEALAPVRRALAAGRPLGPALARAYASAPAQPIDQAVLERSRRVWCLPVSFHWSDVGTWESLAEELGVGPNVTRIMEGEALLCDAGGNLVRGDGRPIVLLGVSDLAVIDSGDAVLVAALPRSGEVRDLVARLRRQGRDELL